MNVADHRIVARAQASIRWRPTDQDGEPVAAAGVPTVVVTRSDGSAVAPVTVELDASVEPAAVKLDLTAAQTADLDVLSVEWSLDGVLRGRTVVDIVGGVYATVGEVRTREPSTAETGRDPTATVLEVRAEVEATFERACGHAVSFVPRFSVLTVRRTCRSGLLPLPLYFVRAVRWASYTATDGTVTSIDVTGARLGAAGISLASAWPARDVTVGVEHGMPAPPADVKRAAIQAIRRGLNRSRSAIDSRAMSHQSPGGEVQRFPTPGLGPWVTGIPEIDEVLKSYRLQFPPALVA